MCLLRWVYTFLTLCGCLPSPSWTYPYKTFLFNVYTVIVLMLVHTLVISQILDVVFIVDNEDDFSENFYVTMPMIVTSFKLCSLLASRRNIVILINALQKEPFVPMNTEEIQIRVRFNKLAEWVCFSVLSDSVGIKMNRDDNNCKPNFQVEHNRLRYLGWNVCGMDVADNIHHRFQKWKVDSTGLAALRLFIADVVQFNLPISIFCSDSSLVGECCLWHSLRWPVDPRLLAVRDTWASSAKYKEK